MIPASKGVTLWKADIKEFLFLSLVVPGKEGTIKEADVLTDGATRWQDEEDRKTGRKNTVISVSGPLFPSPPASPLLHTAPSSLIPVNEPMNF